jgi:hypothetical protein
MDSNISGTASPGIVFTHVPSYGTPDDPNGVADRVQGQVQNAAPSDFYVVVYIKVGSTWWIKPYSFSHLWETPIMSDGTWKCDIWTGGIDEQATIIEAYLVSKLKTPSVLPPARDWLILNADAKAEVSRIDPPTVLSITRVNSNPTTPTDVNFIVAFSKPVTGLDASDFNLIARGIKGASITNLTGSGASYTVTVNTGTGDGIIRLDLVDNDSITDGNNNPLGGIGVGNGSYTDGQTYSIRTGPDTTGVFRPINGIVFLKYSNTTGIADVAINYGLPGDYPLVGDWDGDGVDTIGVDRMGIFYLRNSNTIGFADVVFALGQPGDQPVVGDWDGNGIDDIWLYRRSIGAFLPYCPIGMICIIPTTVPIPFGIPGDIAIAGDWDGDGIDTIGVYRPSNGMLYLKNTNTSGFADIALNYGLPGDQPVVGDWDNDGIDTIGVYRNGTFYLRNENTNGFATIVFDLGNPGDHPVAGNWDGLP